MRTPMESIINSITELPSLQLLNKRVKCFMTHTFFLYCRIKFANQQREQEEAEAQEQQR